MLKLTLVVCAYIAVSNAGVLKAPQAYVANTGAAHIEYHTPTAAVTYHHAPAVQLHTPAIGTSSNSITRSFDGTVSQYTKAVDTAFSSVRKADTRVSNKVYQPTYAYNYVHEPTVVHAPATTVVAAHHHPAPVTVAKTQFLNAPQAHIAYSPAELVSHVEYSAPLIHYAW